MRSLLDWAARLSLPAVVAAFAWLAVARAFQDGVCCADDALFAVAAKDLALGYGYPQGAGHRPDEAYFGLSDGHITVGPVMVVPVAAAVALLGNRHWAPGIASIGLWLLLFACIAVALRPFGGRGRRDIALVLFLILTFAFSAWHFEHWFAMLGEVPAALLVWLAVAIWARRPRSRRHLRVASVLMGLACLTKLVAALCVPPFLLGVAMARGLRGRNRILQAARDMSESLLWSLLPALLFQFYRLAAAGPLSYFDESIRWIRYVLIQATLETRPSSFLAHLAAISRHAYERFGVGPAELVLMSTLSLVLVARRLRPHIRLHAMVLFGSVVANVIWWLFASKGWPRYLLIAILLSSALSVLPILLLRGTLRTLIYCLLVALYTVPNWARAASPIRRGEHGWFSPSVSVRNAMALTARLDTLPSDTRLYSQWWGTVADLEYLSAHVGRFRRLPRHTSSPSRPEHAIALNSTFQGKPDPEFERHLGTCRRDDDTGPPYELYWCP